MGIECDYILSPTKAASPRACPRTHARARTSTRPEDDEAVRTARPKGGGQERGSWTRGEDAACRLPGAAGLRPARIDKAGERLRSQIWLIPDQP